VQEALRKRLAKFGLTLEPNKTKLVEFGRFAHKHASKRGRNRPETIYFLGFTLYCTRNLNGMRHLPIREQVENLNRVLRGHYAYYGVAGNIRALQRTYRAVERYWRKMLSSRSRKGQ